MSDTFDTDPQELPPITKALRECWSDKISPFGQPVTPEPIPSTAALRGILDAVHTLELRVLALEGSG